MYDLVTQNSGQKSQSQLKAVFLKIIIIAKIGTSVLMFHRRTGRIFERIINSHLGLIYKTRIIQNLTRSVSKKHSVKKTATANQLRHPNTDGMLLYFGRVSNNFEQIMELYTI